MRNNLRAMREKLGMTQAALAKLAGVSRVTVNRLECGKSIPGSRTVFRLAAAFCCTPVDLFPAFAGMDTRRAAR